MKVLCGVDHTNIENEHGRDVPGVIVTCNRCNHQTQSYGQHEGSVKRCMMLLKEECPNGERNYYEEGVISNSNQSWRQATTVGGTGAPAQANHVAQQAGGARGGGAQSHQAAQGARKFTSPGSRSTPASSTAPRTGAALPPSEMTAPGVPRLIAENDFCVIKCATTGLSTEKDEIVQIGLVQVDKGAARWRMSVNVKPTVPVGDRAAQIHGLTAERLAFSASFKEIAQDLIGFVGPRVLLGYNITKFDAPMLMRQMREQAGMNVDDIDCLDVLLLERKYAQETYAVNEKQRHGLEDAVRRWGLADRLSVTHDGLNDAKIVWAIFVELCRRFPELGDGSLANAFEILKAEGALTAMGLRTAAKFAHLR